ncbi:MAG: alpha/beta fold hydrolase [Gudongella sp.]|nr:alpha/beta fold hydrolase [Gudongella sp.]
MIDAFKLKSRGKDMACIMEYKNLESKGKNILLFNHGFVGHKITPHRMIVNLSHELVEEYDLTVVRFDFIGSGDSDGDYNYMTIPGEVKDSLHVVEYLRNNYKINKLIILGYSMGGCIASLTASKTNTDALILWSPVSSPYKNFKYLLGDKLFEEGELGNDVDFLGDMVSSNFFTDLKRIDIIKELKKFESPIYIIHGDKDEDVLPENALSYLNATGNTKLYYVKNAGHTYDSRKLQRDLFDKTKEYVKEIIKNK